MRIGYQGYSHDLSHPADRRRIGFWSKERNIPLVLDSSRELDFMVFTSRSDMENVVKYEGGYKILDLIDGYSTFDSQISDIGRGFVKNLTGQISGRPRRYSKNVQRACQYVDMVICSSKEQAELISAYNSNVRVILDSHHEFLQPNKSMNPLHSDQNSIFWEGQTATLHALHQISTPLIEIYKEQNFRLELVTDKKHKLLMNRYISTKSDNQIPNLKRYLGDAVSLHTWSKELVIEIAKRSTLGIVPVNMNSAIQRLKPENRIMIMWTLGLPCLASDTPSHRRLAKQTQLDFICRSPYEWKQKLSLYLTDPIVRENQLAVGKRYLLEFHNKEIILNKWDKIFGLDYH